MSDFLDFPVVSSIVVQATTEGLNSARDFVLAHPQAEMHGSDEISKLVVVVEMENDRTLSDFMTEIGNIPGVITVNMVFHHTDQLDSTATKSAAVG